MPLQLDYFYGGEADQFSFYRIPKVMLCAGVMFGSAISGPAASAAQAALTALPSTKSFYVDGKPATLEAYNINGFNYVKLSDLSKLAGFELAYDPDTDSVYIGKQPAKSAPDGTVTLPADGSKYMPGLALLLTATFLPGNRQGRAVALSWH